MTKQEILDGNKLIAEFACIKNKDGSIYSATLGGYPEGTMHFNLNRCPINTLYPFDHEYAYSYNGRWHSEWNWLIPVVEKIESLGFNTFVNYDVNIRDNKKHICQISDHIHANYPYIYIRGVDKITSVYMAIIEFIKWNNTIKDESK